VSILVLPLVNQTGDAPRQYVADGLTTAITADFSRIRDAVIVPPLAAVALHEQRLSLAQLRAQAQVRLVLDGAVAAAGDRLRITLRLSDALNNRQVWSQVWSHVHEAALADLFGLQDELTARVRASVGPQMLLTAAPGTLPAGRERTVDLRRCCTR
jgi:adenylate cyclase